jgi:hypothetical protein
MRNGLVTGFQSFDVVCGRLRAGTVFGPNAGQSTLRHVFGAVLVSRALLNAFQAREAGDLPDCGSNWPPRNRVYTEQNVNLV